MRLSTWRYAFRDAAGSFRTNRFSSLSAIATVSVSLLMLALFLVVAINLDSMATSLENQVEIKAWLDPALKDEDISRMSDEIKSFTGVKSVIYVSNTEAMQRLADRLGNQQALEYVGTNPLRPSFEVKTQRPDDVAPVAEAVTSKPGVQKVDYKSDTVDKLFRITRGLRVFSLALVLALAAATTFVISNTIRLTVFARRREIGIMKLVGATDSYIRRPFVLEGMFFGLIGSLFASALSSWIYAGFLRFASANLPFFEIVPGSPLLRNLTLTLMGLGVVLGALGSAVSVRRFLRV